VCDSGAFLGRFDVVLVDGNGDKATSVFEPIVTEIWPRVLSQMVRFGKGLGQQL
jgi:hypothetical protein